MAGRAFGNASDREFDDSDDDEHALYLNDEGADASMADDEDDEDASIARTRRFYDVGG